jgi:SAM-dependent methyltransferase
VRFFSRRRAIGVVDTRGSRIRGWAFDQSAGSSARVEFYVDGKQAGSAIADLHRADLVAVCPGGNCAFDFTLPAELLDGNERTVEVRLQGAARPLTGGRFKARLREPDYFAGLTRRILRSGTWAMSGDLADGSANIRGWCIAPPGTQGGRITVNGRAVALAITKPSREWASPLPADMTVRSFAGHVPLQPSGATLRLSFGREAPFRPLQDFHYPLFNVAMPDMASRLRVDGDGSDFAFNLLGCSTAIKLDVVAERFAGRTLAGLGPVLDWGCGCGRVARFVARTGAALHGVDIDAANARWCSENIDGQFSAVSPEPPAPFEDETFGAVYGISVFSHLNRHYEKLWLGELRRIAKPGALLLLSVLGRHAAACGGLLDHVTSEEFDDGFADIGRNRDIDQVTGTSEYYRNVFHQPSYIRQVWGRYFEILAIEEGIVGNLQDLVVARKPVR